MRLTISLITSILATTAVARKFFIGSYGGEIRTVDFNEKSGELTQLSTTFDSSPSPSWLEISPDKKVLYTIEETAHNNSDKGGVSSYSIGEDGKLTKIASAQGQKGPVSLNVSPDRKTLFTANYGGGISAYSTDPSGVLTWLKDWTFKLTGPPTVPERQDGAHPHQALFDSTGKYVLFPDLGADLIRVFGVSGKTFTELTSVGAKPGTGPRHGMLYPLTGTPKFYYLVGELGNTINTFSVEYMTDQLELKQIQSLSTLSPTSPADVYPPPDSDPAAASELAISPCGSYVYVSNRGDHAFPGSDSIAFYTRNLETGLLTYVRSFPSGVTKMRHISLDPTGQWLVAEGQGSSDVKVLKRDTSTGELNTTPVASMAVKAGPEGGPACVVWLD